MSRTATSRATAQLAPLVPGDTVALLSPSGPPNPVLVDSAVAGLESLGLRVQRRPSLTAVHPRARYLAGDDRARADDLTDAWCDPSVAAVVCARGGYGAVRMLDLLDRDTLAAATAKPLLGSSDVTAVHEWWAKNLGLATWFTPMPATPDGLDDVARAGLADALLRGLVPTEHGGGRALTEVRGAVSGPLVGGNLSLLAMTLGAPGHRLDHRGAIVLLEDVFEDTYKLDGYLVSLLRAGWFDGVAGVALGTWKDCEPGEVEALCTELLGPLGVPLVAGLPFGHGPGGHSIALGAPVELDAAAGTLRQL